MTTALMEIPVPRPVKLLEEINAEGEKAKRCLALGKEAGMAMPAVERRVKLLAQRGRALAAGFVPVRVGYITQIDPLPVGKWALRDAKTALRQMPPEAKEVLDQAREKGLFDRFGVASEGGDPVLLGLTGDWRFLLAFWLPSLIPGQPYIGIRVRLT